MSFIQNSLNSEINNEIDTIVQNYISLDLISKDKLFDNVFFNEFLQHIHYCILTLPNYSNQIDNTNFNSTLDNLISEYLVKYSNIVIPVFNQSHSNYLSSKIKYLEKVPQPEQRTPEWYTFRNNRLTASDFQSVIDEYDKLSKPKYKPSAKFRELIAKKCGVEIPFIKGAAINHGIKFEPIATSIYESRNNITVLEFGCLPHQHIPFFGASPDGIVSNNSKNQEYVGRMLEIKCPKSRPITGVIPKGYYSQMQGQLEVCDLEYCDFLECDFQFYPDDDAFFKDIGDIQPEYDNSLHYVKNKQNKEIGCILELFDTKLQKSHYHYATADLFRDRDTFKDWEQKHIEKVFKNTHIEYIGTLFWYINKYNVVLVKRAREWFNNNYIKIEYFWENVKKYRENGNAKSLVSKKKYEPYKQNEVDFIN